MIDRTSSNSVLLCAQYLREGAGGIAEVARLTAAALGQRHAMTALSCMDRGEFAVGDVAVRGFAGSRLRFVAQLAFAAGRSTHIIYDFAGTARAHSVLKFRDRPSAIWAHGWEVWGKPRADYVRALERADLVLVNSHYNLERAAGALGRAKAVRVCPLATWRDDLPEPTVGIDGPPTVLLLGRIDSLLAKGHEILISIWPKVVSALPDARLVLAGGGDAVAHVEVLARASAAAANIDVLGFVPSDRLVEVWRRTCVFAMPGFAEGFGLVYIEAMRQGKPIIASRDDAGQEINLDGVTGFNISRNKPDEIAQALIVLLRDGDMRRRFGEAGREHWKANYTFSCFERRLFGATGEFLAL